MDNACSQYKIYWKLKKKLFTQMLTNIIIETRLDPAICALQLINIIIC